MATMRGRKRTDDPTPNRARDIQRAFRARRAAHLESLEQRIRELDEENNYFRRLLNLPPASRPALGKGPTGRGVAKSRSRLNDGIDKCGSPEPTSDASTPPIEYPLTLTSGVGDGYPSSVPGSADGLNPPNSSMGTHGTPNAKMLHEFVPADIYGDSIIHSQPFHEVEGPAPILPFGYSEENPWAVNPDASLNPTFSTDVTPTLETPRYYMFPPQAELSPRPQTMVMQQHPVQTRPNGHRRCHTEPQSLGSLLPPFSPTHRATNSQPFVAVVAHDLSPSPPPLPIRSTLQGFR